MIARLARWLRAAADALDTDSGGVNAPARRRASRVHMKGGQVLMGPLQPRPQVQARIPSPPPRAARR